MKLMFLVPNDEIKLLEHGVRTPTEQQFDFLDRWSFIPKDTVLRVSQVYIRKSGWFDSSLTFKILSGPGFEKYKIEWRESLMKSTINRIDMFQKELNDLIEHDAFFYYTLKRENFKIKHYCKSIESGQPDGLMVKLHSMDRPWYENEINILKINLEKIKTMQPGNLTRVIRVLLTDIIKWDVEIIKSKLNVL